MAFRQYQQRDFSGGEIDSSYIARADLKSRGMSLQRAENVRILNSGALTVRPGSERLPGRFGRGRLEMLSVKGDTYVALLTAQQVTIYFKATRAIVAIVAGPWTDAQVPELVLAPYGSQLFVFHQSFVPQIIARADDGSWSVAPLTFYDSTGGGDLRQPFHRFAPLNLTVTPSATSGQVTLTASAPYFAAGMQRLRLAGRNVALASIQSPTSATAIVVDQLYPTRVVPLDSASGYQIGETVKGTSSNAEGTVVGVDANSITVVMDTFIDFTYIAATSSTAVVNEKVVGLHAAGTTTAATTIAAPGPVLDVTEAVLSLLRGYPGTGVVHDNRLMMARFPQVPFGIAASAINAFTDFEVGTNNDDAFFVLIGDQDSGQIQHLHSAEQLLILTTRHLLYVPESESYPITPTNLAILKAAPDGASLTQPVSISEGVVYVQTAGGALIGALQTGNVRDSWKTADFSYQAAHLVRQPVSMAYVSGAPDVNERYVYLVNADGGMSVLSYDQSDSETAPALVPWTTNGSYAAVAATDGECWALVWRDTAYFLEVFDPAALLDSQSVAPASAYAGPAAPNTFVAPGDPQSLVAAAVYRMPDYAGTYCDLMIGGVYAGRVGVTADGFFSVPDLPGDIYIGFAFAPVCIPWPPLDPEDQNPRRRKRRISAAVVRSRSVGMQVNDTQRPLYEGGEDTGAAPPVRDDVWRFPCFGWAYEPTVTLTRGCPGAWELDEVSLEVSG